MIKKLKGHDPETEHVISNSDTTVTQRYQHKIGKITIQQPLDYLLRQLLTSPQANREQTVQCKFYLKRQIVNNKIHNDNKL